MVNQYDIRTGCVRCHQLLLVIKNEIYSLHFCLKKLISPEGCHNDKLDVFIPCILSMVVGNLQWVQFHWMMIFNKINRIWWKSRWFLCLSAYINDLKQDCSISLANTLEILQSYTKPLIQSGKMCMPIIKIPSYIISSCYQIHHDYINPWKIIPMIHSF